MIVGTGLGLNFGASSLYLVLKVGLTVSASVPVAVIAASNGGTTSQDLKTGFLVAARH